MAQKAKTVARGYGEAHRALRRVVAKQVEMGAYACARCGKQILPGEPWDLGHDDYDRTIYTGPEHRPVTGRRTADGRHRGDGENGELLPYQGS
jgi:hypothetical protein